MSKTPTQIKRPLRQIFIYLALLSLVSLGVLGLALYRGQQSAQLNEAADYVGHLRTSALLIYIAGERENASYRETPTLVQMGVQIATLSNRYPEYCVDLEAAWRQFYREIRNSHIISWETANALSLEADRFSHIISERARDEARNGNIMLVCGALGFLLLLIRGTFLSIELYRTGIALDGSRRRFAALADATFEGIFISENGIILDANQQLARLLGYELNEVIGRHLLDFVAEDYHDLVREAIARKSEDTYEVVCVRKDKSTFYAEVASRVIVQSDGSEVRMTVGRDITQFKRLEQSWRDTKHSLEIAKERWRTIATRDSLTGAYTRRALQQILNREIERSVHSGMPFSVMMLDLDNFKSYNDEFGHIAGDELLRHVVDVLRGTLRNIDVIARYGGDEFVIVLINTTELEARVVAKKCLEEIRNTTCFERKVTISLGVITCFFEPDLEINWSICQEITEGILSRIDNALYQSKEAGRNQVTIAPRFHATRKNIAM